MVTIGSTLADETKSPHSTVPLDDVVHDDDHVAEDGDDVPLTSTHRHTGTREDRSPKGLNPAGLTGTLPSPFLSKVQLGKGREIPQVFVSEGGRRRLIH